MMSLCFLSETAYQYVLFNLLFDIKKGLEKRPLVS